MRATVIAPRGALLVLAVIGAAGGLTGCAKPAGPTAEQARRLPYYDSPEYTPRWDVAGEDPALHRVRPFHLTNQRGEAFTDQDLRGKITVADFFFTSCPSVCVQLATSMADLQRHFLDDDGVVLISHSVTPDLDTVEVLQRYAAEHHVDFRRWKLLTGRREEIYDLGRKSYFVEEDLGERKSADDFLHTENFVLLDGQLHLRGIYNGLDPSSMKALVADIAVLKRER